jgi:internalin A
MRFTWVLLLCLAASPVCRADDAEDKAVALVEKLGATVTRDEKLPGKPVVEVDLHSTAVTDAALKQLAALKNLTALSLSETKVTDAGLKELTTLKNLTTLHLHYTKVMDAGLKVLAALKNLTALDLMFTEVTDAGVKELQKALPKCKITK